MSANYPSFLELLSQPQLGHADLSPLFLATLLDEFIQEHPPNFDHAAKVNLYRAIHYRFTNIPDFDASRSPPTIVLASLCLVRLLDEHNKLVLRLHEAGSEMTADEDKCRAFLSKKDTLIDEEQVAAAILYCAISRTITFSPKVLVATLRGRVKNPFNWQKVVSSFDQPDLYVTDKQLLAIYEALLPLANDKLLDIQQLWGGIWQNPETQLSFLGAYASLTPELLDASLVPGVETTFTLEEFSNSTPETREAASIAIRHPLVSKAAVTAIFHVALSSTMVTTTTEARRLFSNVIVPNLDIFVVSAISVRDTWSDVATETVNKLVDRYIHKLSPGYDFVLEALWRRDKMWLAGQLAEIHAETPLALTTILEHAVQHGWLPELTSMLTGFGLDLAALAHAEGLLDLEQWQLANDSRSHELASALLQFLNIKASHELTCQRGGDRQTLTVMLPVKTVSALLQILESILPRTSAPELIIVQRMCITAYPRLINYAQGYDDIIDANGRQGNSLPKEANAKMEKHYKRMYSQKSEVGEVVNALQNYKHSRDPEDQDVFACMIHGLFDEYSLYGTYPLEALATTAVLFGAIISRKLISGLPLEIGLGMILEALRDSVPPDSMHKFGLQALIQVLPRLQEWVGFCAQLLDIPALEGTEAYKHAEEIVRNDEADRVRSGHSHPEPNGEAKHDARVDEIRESAAPPFSSVNAEPSPHDGIYEDPNEDTQDKVQFVLNNITEQNVASRFQELKDAINVKHQQWFAGHLVAERAKLQPNYHGLYLDLVKLFENKSLWGEILRETYICIIQMLNAESTMKSSSERTHLKNLGGWLGSLTLARDKPIKHRNIAFKELLLEAFDTQRLVVVIPFVCKVLAAGAQSTVFRPPNPWLMDIIYLLIELYHHAELKLNQKFEIEVLCKGLNLDHNSIEPSAVILSRRPIVNEELPETLAPEILDRFDNLSMSGMGGGVASGRFSPAEIASTIPDLGPLLSYPPVNDMVNQQRLHDIVRNAITRAVHEIIAPVVERSVTIAAISTAQMIRKDFATESDASRMRSAAINMVKKTAGSLALVTSKEPLRASMTNYIRQYSSELPQMLPEGTIIMCVNSNLDLACGQVEKKAEERAVPEIEEMLEVEFEARRRHRALRPEEVYMDSTTLNRWALTIPSPYKLQPALGGLNAEQMAIYDEFSRIQPRAPSAAGHHHVASTSDATQSMANDILQDQFAVPNLPTPGETPSLSHPGSQQPLYAQTNPGLANGRVPAALVNNAQNLPERVQKLFAELQRAADEAPEQHYTELPRPHPVLDILDAIYALIIRSQQYPEAFDMWIADEICAIIFGANADDLVVESLVYMLQNICRIGGRTAKTVYMNIGQQPAASFQNVSLVTTLVATELVDWSRIDFVTSKELAARKPGCLEYFSALLDHILLDESPVALFTDLARSLEVAYEWIEEDPTLEAGQLLRQKLASSGFTKPSHSDDDRFQAAQVQMEYVFSEWLHLCSNPNASDKSLGLFISQMYNKQVINSRDDLYLFLRTCIDAAVDRLERQLQSNVMLNDAYSALDALAKLIALLVKGYEHDGEVKLDKNAFFKSILSLSVLIINHHHQVRGERFNQKAFFRFYSSLLSELSFVFQASVEYPQMLIEFARNLETLRPATFPGFFFAWLGLISHRDLLHPMMTMPNERGWPSLCRLIDILFQYLGELVTPLQMPMVAKEISRSVTKLLLMLQHDYPDFVAANSLVLCTAIPSHCLQLRNLVLNANPAQTKKVPDPLQPGLNLDRMEAMRQIPLETDDVRASLLDADLLGVLDQALQNGPSEDAVAHITHTVQRGKSHDAKRSFVPVTIDISLIQAIVIHIGSHSAKATSQLNAPEYNENAADAKLISMLVHELTPEARYCFLSSMADQLRFPNAHTHYFSQALLGLFGTDQHDQEEYDIQQQICRTLLERLLGQWPQPWGLVVTVLELIKNDKYMFFELPFIKSAPEVRCMHRTLGH